MSDIKPPYLWCSGCGAKKVREDDPPHKYTDPGHSGYVEPEPSGASCHVAETDIDRLATALIPLGGWAGHKAADVWREGSAYEVAKAIAEAYRAAAAPAEAREEAHD